jgi:hypothetical protein
LNFPAGVWGISNGAVWIDQFQPLPWFSNNNDDTYNAITIAPVVPVAVSTIAFTGPGVTYSTNGGTTFINIDPFDQVISVGYGEGGARLSSVYEGLTLTTAGDGEDLNLRPLGDVNIEGGSRSDNQPGSGYRVYIYGGDAHDDPNSPGQDYNGGNVRIEGGDAVNAGTPGDVWITSNNNTWQFMPTGNLTLPSNTSSINYANGDPYGGGGGNTGNVTFNDQTVVGTGDPAGSGGLYLAPGTESVGNLQYWRVRGGDVATHMHLDTGNNAYYDQYFGSDIKYVKLEAAGNVQIGSDDDTGNSAEWTFGTDGNLTLPNGAVLKDNAGNAVTFGYTAGVNSQGNGAVAVGIAAGQGTQGEFSVAVGPYAGLAAQGNSAVAVGFGAGQTDQGAQSVAVGAGSGLEQQGAGAVAIGVYAGANSQGLNSVAIGSSAGYIGQGNNSIILNATGGALNQTTANTFTVAPVRQANTANALYYDSSTGEITYDTAGGGGLPLANGTSNINIATANSDVTITANGSPTWTFGTGGTMQCPLLTYTTLPSPVLPGQRAFITDSTLEAAGNFGSNAFVGGGSNTVPVFSDGSDWWIG